MFSLEVPNDNSEVVKVSLNKGDVLYVLGANGAGKSTLIFNWVKADPSSVLIPGNREVIFSSSAVSISAEQAGRENGWAKSNLYDENARVGKAYHNNTERLNRLLFRIKSMSDDVNKRYRQAHQNGKSDELNDINASEPILLINKALKSASIGIELDWSDNSELIAKKNSNLVGYGIQKMSDGERASLIIASEVVAADKESIIFIDEPERHLHRSISSPLLQFLKSIRPDLCWVIATHDLSLLRDDAIAKILILYNYFGNNTWKAELLPDTSELPNFMSEAIYGARQKILFVEGNEESLDLRVYQKIFKNITIVPVGSCRDVCDAIAGMKASFGTHYLECKGIVDGDNRTDKDSLKDKGVNILNIYAVESVYYHPEVVKEMLRFSPENISIESVASVVIDSLNNLEYLAKITAYRRYRENYLKSLLSDEDFSSKSVVTEVVDGPQIISKEIEEIHKLKSDNGWLGIVERYKIKSTGIPDKIARKLGFLGKHQYEMALLKNLDV